MKKKTAFIAAIWMLGLANSHAAENWPTIGQGVNLDFTTTEVNKVGYDPGFYEAFGAAGFDSGRFFVKHGQGPRVYKRTIDDALDRGLTVVITIFSGKTNGKEAFVEFWREYAEFYRLYPKELVFEIMNEPEMAGHHNTEEVSVVVMDWIGDAIVAVRKTNPTRVIAVGGTGHNNIEYIHYVSPKYLDYRLPDGTGFNEDENIWGVFHLYRPSKWSHAGKRISLDKANPDWRDEVVWHLDEAVKWSKKHNKKVILTEWGTRMYNDPEDIKAYFRFMVDEAGKRGIDWMYYCGVFNNPWPFALYSSENGWDESADYVEILTGVKPTVVPPTSQINNSSFDMDTVHWYSDNQVNLGTADYEGVNGSRAMRCMVAFVKPNVPAVYQQSHPNWKWKSEGRHMLQLRKGNTYDISFYAKTPVNKTTLRAQLGVAPKNDRILWTSEPVRINTELTKYTFTYKHKTESIEDVRFSILFTERHSEIILDDIKLRGTRPDYRPVE